ncbi:MAG: PDZ domain-containing protein, partial [Gemmatimonadales bacterium]
LDLITVTPAIQGERGLRSEQGALIIGIAPDIARSTGLRQGDVIVAINRTMIESAGQVGEIFDGITPRQLLRIHIERDRQYAFTDLAFR